jgi:hypothetical protein
VEIAAFHLTGVAQHWFYMLQRDIGNIHALSWPLFRSLCQQRFGPPLGTNHLSELARLTCRGSVKDYQEAFLARLAHAGFLSQCQQVQLFTGGLPDSIRIDVELQAPEDLQRAMYLARAYERRALPPSGSFTARPRFVPRSTSLPTASSSTTTLVSVTTPQTSSTVQPPRPFRRLTPAEMTERRRMGLCYNCDDQYVKGHKCPQLFYLEVSDYDEVDAEPEQSEEEMPPTNLTPCHYWDSY